MSVRGCAVLWVPKLDSLRAGAQSDPSWTRAIDRTASEVDFASSVASPLSLTDEAARRPAGGP